MLLFSIAALLYLLLPLASCSHDFKETANISSRWFYWHGMKHPEGGEYAPYYANTWEEVQEVTQQLLYGYSNPGTRMCKASQPLTRT